MNKQEKFSELLNPVLKRLEKYALAISGNRADAKEIVSETLLHAYQNFEKLKDEKSFLSFLFTIATRVKHQLFRKTKRIELVPIDEFDRIIASQTDPETLTDISLVRNAISKLNEKEREILVLKEFSGFSLKEISQILGVSVSVVKVRIHRAKKSLSKLLK